MPDGPSRPNFLVVVMDCVRASDFAGGSAPVENMPWTERLLRESFVFPRAVSVAPWTIPAHASLFTGLYPWEHGCHARGSLTLNADIPRLAEMLRPLGYASFSVAANPFINSSFGLVKGFDRAAWGGWWESYARLPRSQPPSEAGLDGASEDSLLLRLRRGRLGTTLVNRLDDAYRRPYLLDAANRVIHGLRTRDIPGGAGVSPWIEPTLDRWIDSVEADRPFFAFVNLVDAHEPYFANPEVVATWRQYLEYSRTRQDHIGYAAGKWSLDPESAELLHRLYRASIRAIDRRLARLEQILARHGRWDDTAMILTSDHGQAFGEHGVLFHMFRPDDCELRIPLVYRPAGGTSHRVARGWATLVDVAPTLLAAAGADRPNLPSAVPLDRLVSSDRPGPALSMSDGLIFGHVRTRFEPARRDLFDRVWGVAYQGNRKVLVESGSRSVREYDVAADPEERQNVYARRSESVDPLEGSAREVTRLMTSAPRVAPSPEVADRLRSWGY
jgi:arylsulfatase A-like enzyme